MRGWGSQSGSNLDPTLPSLHLVRIQTHEAPSAVSFSTTGLYRLCRPWKPRALGFRVPTIPKGKSPRTQETRVGDSPPTTFCPKE